MTKLVGLLFLAMYALACGLWITRARTLFDAVWLIGIVSTPSSLLASTVSRWLGEWLLNDRPGVVMDLVLVCLLGAAQYFVLGLAIGWVIDLIRERLA